jgi:predicted enzyme related to lactoylglutathione lyase
MKYAVSIDVPNLEDGLKFYRDALSLPEVTRPMPTYVLLQCGDARIGLIEKSAGSKPAKGSDDVRRYERHWTPVHIDFHVDDFDDFLTKAVNAGAICEQKYAIAGRPPIAFCSDPFGNGFCVLGALPK